MPQPCGAAAHACMRNGNLNGTLGALRPQTPDQGRNAPGPSLGETACKNIPDKRRLPRWGIRKLGASGPRKPGKSQGKSLLFPRDYSLAFPGCKTSGMAAKGGRARSATLASWAIPAKQQRKVACSTCQAYSVSEGPGRSPPWRRVWGRGGPRVTLGNSCVSPGTPGLRNCIFRRIQV